MPRRSQTAITEKLVRSAKPKDTAYDIRDRDMKGFMLRVQPSGSKAYYCTWARGKRSRIGDAKLLTLTRAREIAEQRIAAAKRGEVPKTEIRVKSKTLRQFIDGPYAADAEQTQKQGAENCQRLIGVLGELLDVQLDRLTSWQLDKWRAARVSSGRAASTINRDLTQLKAALAKAVEWELIDQNPASKVKRLKGANEQRVRYLTKREEKRLMKAIDEREDRLREERESGNEWRQERGIEPLPRIGRNAYADHLKPLVLLSINTGLRWGEVSSLTWANTKLSRSPLVTVRAAHAKSGQTRHVPLNKQAVTVLRKWRDQSPDTSGHVFPGKGGGALVSVRKPWASVLTEAKIDDFRWHDLRHHFGSSLVMRGVDLNTVRELLGHGSIDMTLRYAHLAPEHKAAAVALLEE